MTGPEKKLWDNLRNRKLADLKFRRQHPIGVYIVDFCCDETRVVIELDGNSHNESFEYDEHRQNVLEQLGFHVIRFDNDDVLQDIDAVLDGILLACGKTI